MFWTDASWHFCDIAADVKSDVVHTFMTTFPNVELHSVNIFSTKLSSSLLQDKKMLCGTKPETIEQLIVTIKENVWKTAQVLTNGLMLRL